MRDFLCLKEEINGRIENLPESKKKKKSCPHLSPLMERHISNTAYGMDQVHGTCARHWVLCQVPLCASPLWSSVVLNAFSMSIPSLPGPDLGTQM